MKPWLKWAALVVALGVVAAGITVAVLTNRAHERDLDRRCAAAGGRRVVVGSYDEKLCFTEDWRWVQI